MITALFFVVSLPLAVQLLGAALHAFDHLDPARGLLRLCVYLSMLVALVLVAGADHRVGIAWAFAVVFTLHLLAQLIMRLGVRYEWWCSERLDPPEGV